MQISLTSLFVIATAMPATAQLYVGLETGTPVPMEVSDLGGFPGVTWTSFHAIDVSGAAARPDGTLYVCNGAFTTKLYVIPPGSSPSLLSTVDIDISGMAFGRGRLYGYSNYATPKGIYEIDPATGSTTLVLDVYTGTSYRFFAFDYNPVDDLFYGYTEYGTSGLYSIDIDTGVMTFLAGGIPASNTQGRGMAVGNNTVYLTATRGDDGIPFFAYDLSQGVGGTWVGFTNPYPNHHSTGGSAWVPGPDPGVAYCPGDGTGTGCPCGNNSDGSAMGGCDWGNPAYPAGGSLTAIGSDSIAANNTYLVAGSIENNFGIFFGANDPVNGGSGNVLNDGLRCAGNALVRLIPPTSATGNQAVLPATVQSLDTGAAAGVTRRYQYWFRTPNGPCGTSANLTNGYEILWVP